MFWGLSSANNRAKDIKKKLNNLLKAESYSGMFGGREDPTSPSAVPILRAVGR